jgi:hypothetical protein
MITSVWRSPSQYWMKSLPDRSALFPTETKDESPEPSACARAITANPRPPLWDRKPMRPGIGRSGAKVASRLTSAAVLITPMQFGPTSRMPACRQMSISSRCRATPSGPASPNPEEITTRARTPFSAHSRATLETTAAGTVTTAISTSPGTASTVGKAATPSISVAPGFTG